MSHWEDKVMTATLFLAQLIGQISSTLLLRQFKVFLALKKRTDVENISDRLFCQDHFVVAVVDEHKCCLECINVHSFIVYLHRLNASIKFLESVHENESKKRALLIAHASTRPRWSET